MPLITPIDQPQRELADRILRETGLLPSNDTSKRVRKSKMSQALAERNLDLEDIAENLSSIARNAEKDSDKIKVNELALKLHGELEKDNGGVDISITFTGVDNGMMQVLIPRQL